MAASMFRAERALGIDARLCNANNRDTWIQAHTCDVHVSHVHFPDEVRPQLTKPPKIVWVAHGTPEHVFQLSVDTGLAKKGQYGFSDPFMMAQNSLRRADARVTFWPRHQAIWQTMVPKGVPIDCVPMGVEQDFWCSGESRGKWAGNPSLFTAENAWASKSPLDLLLLWPWIAEQMHEATLHVCKLPQDQHRWWFPLVNANGSHFRAYLSDIQWQPDDLRNVFRSIDFFIGLVRYGDHNHLSMQANACGAKTISYRGNVYADYWLTEGDQRVMLAELLAILRGETEPRQKEPVPDISETAKAMQSIYERIA